MERKQEEDKMQDHYHFLQALIDNIPNPIFYKDINGRYMGCNKAFEAYIGLGRDEIVGKTVYDIAPKEKADIYFEMDDALFRQPGIQTYESTVRYADGSTHNVIFNKSTFYNADGSMAGLVGIILDITERKAFEDALRNSEEKYRAFFMTSRDCVFITSRDGRWLDSNEAAVDFFGYENRAELYKVNVKDLYENPEERKIFTQPIEKTGFIHDYAVNLRKKDGSIINALITFVAMRDGKGNIVGYQGTIKDITHRRRMEEELLRVRKLESVGILTGGMAHDFNNLLSIIMGNITLARDEVGYGTQVYELLTNAETASQKMRMVIRQLSSLAGGHVLSLRAADIAALVRETADNILHGSSVRCRYDFPGDLWSVACDEEQMRHVMRILISNAREAMSEGGLIEFFGENLAIEREGQAAGLPLLLGRYVRVSVRDHGVGISEENLPRIFDPYFSTKERGIQKGMGLDLATSYAIIRKHNGHITVESRLNEGTTFHIYLPAVQEKDSEG